MNFFSVKITLILRFNVVLTDGLHILKYFNVNKLDKPGERLSAAKIIIKIYLLLFLKKKASGI